MRGQLPSQEPNYEDPLVHDQEEHSNVEPHDDTLNVDNLIQSMELILLNIKVVFVNIDDFTEELEAKNIESRRLAKEGKKKRQEEAQTKHALEGSTSSSI